MGDGLHSRCDRFGRKATRSMAVAVLAVTVTGAAWANCQTAGQPDAFAVGASLAGGAPAADAARLSDAERAMAVRVLQSDLMVAGLACGARSEYGQFVVKYRDRLVKNGTALRAHFSSVHGSSEGFKKLNTYVTRVANQASSRMAKRGSAFCKQAMSLLGALMASGPEALETHSVRYVAWLDEPVRVKGAGDIQLAESCPSTAGSQEAIALTGE